jgi:hypothetical protein
MGRWYRGYYDQRMTEIPVYPPGQAPDSSGGAAPDTMHGLVAAIHGHLGRIADRLPDPRRIRAEEASHVWSVTMDPVPIALNGGFGVLDVPNQFSPQLGEHWDIHTISATGFTAGSVTGWVNLDGQQLTAASILNAALRFSASSAGYANFGKGQCHLRPQDRLTFVAAGITVPTGGQVLVSFEATRVADAYWGRYLI